MDPKKRNSNILLLALYFIEEQEFGRVTYLKICHKNKTRKDLCFLKYRNMKKYNTIDYLFRKTPVLQKCKHIFFTLDYHTDVIFN